MASETTIRVKHLKGEEYPTSIALEETIGALKEKVAEASGIATARQRLIYKGKEVHNHVQLAAAGLSDGSVIHLVERLIVPAPEGRTPTFPAGDAQPGAAQAEHTAFAGAGLEAVHAIVSQVVGGLLGPPTTHVSRPGSPRTPRRRRRAPPPLNGLVALHGYLSRLSELEALDEPPAMLPVVRTGLPDSHHSWNAVTNATTAVLNSNREQHGSLVQALVAASGGTVIQESTIEPLEALLQRAVDSQQQPEHAQQGQGSGSTPLGGAASEPAGAPVATSDTAPVQPTAATFASPPSDTYEFMPLVVLAYALTMSRAAEGLQRFAEQFSACAASLARDVLRDIEDGSATFDRSQVPMEGLGTMANRLSGLAVESAYLCGLFANAVRGDHRMLADGMQPVVLMTDQQHSRALRHAATIMPAAFPQARAQGAAAAAGSPAQQTEPEALPRISINPGFAPMMVGSQTLLQMAPGRDTANRTRMATAAPAGAAADTAADAAAGAAGDAQGGIDPAAALSLFRGMLGPTASMAGLPGSFPGDPMTANLVAGMQSGAPDGSRTGEFHAAAGEGPNGSAVPPHSSEQQVHNLPIFNLDPASASGSNVPTGAAGMPLTGIHISSSIVTGGLPFGSAVGPDASATAGADGGDGTGESGAGPSRDDLNDVGGMIIQVELPQDGGNVTSIQTTGIGQLGSVLQNMMQEQLASARERMRGRVASGTADGVAQGPVGSESAATASGSADGGSADGVAGSATGSARSAASAAEVSLPTRVLRLTQQLVSDVRRQQELPQEEREAEASRLTRQYLQQVPDMLRQALPQVASEVDGFLQRGSSSNDAAPGGASGAEVPVAAAATSTASNPRSASPPAATATSDTAAVAPETADEAEPPKEAMGTGEAAEATSAAASTSAAAVPDSTSRGPSLSKRPEPKGLAGGLKPRKSRSAVGGTSPAAASTNSSAPPASTSANTATAAAVASGGGGGSGGGSPLDMLMPLMQSPQMQQMLSSPQLQGMAEQMSSGNADIGSLMQSMMPMVSSMLGGGAPREGGPGVAMAPSEGARSQTESARHAQENAPAMNSAEMNALLVKELGAEEAARWQEVMPGDKRALKASGASTAHSGAYAAGSTKAADGDTGFMF